MYTDRDVSASQMHRNPNPRPITWKCLTPLAFNIPLSLSNQVLGADPNPPNIFDCFFSRPCLLFYYFDMNGTRVDVFEFDHFLGFWKEAGDGIIWQGLHMLDGDCTWKILHGVHHPPHPPPQR